MAKNNFVTVSIVDLLRSGKVFEKNRIASPFLNTLKCVNNRVTKVVTNVTTDDEFETFHEMPLRFVALLVNLISY